MAFFLIVLIAIVIFAFRKRIRMCFERLEGPIGRIFNRQRRPSSGSSHEGPPYRSVQNQRVYQHAQPTQYVQQYPPQGQYGYPPASGYEGQQLGAYPSQQGGFSPQGGYSQAQMMTSTMSTDERRAQRTNQENPYSGTVGRSGNPGEVDSTNPYLR